MTLAIYVPVTGPVSVGPVIDASEYVGGYATWVPVTQHLGMMVADHGKIGPFSSPPYTTHPQNYYLPNVRATWLYSTFRAIDWIVGPVMVVGSPYFVKGDDEEEPVQPSRSAIFNLFAEYSGSGVCDWCQSADYDLAFDLNIKFGDRRMWGYTCSQCAVDSSKGSRPRLGTGYGQIMVPQGELEKLGKVSE